MQDVRGGTILTEWDRRFLEMAALVSTWSRDPSTKVGAVIVAPNKHVLSTGFNGFPAAMPDKLEYMTNREQKYSRIIHGEVNALLFARTPLPEGCTLYTHPFMPCDRCVVQMLQAGIKRFVSRYPTRDARERWSEAFERSRAYILECGGTLLEAM